MTDLPIPEQRTTSPLPPSDTTKIVLVDDHALFAESLQIALDLEGYDVRRIELDPEGGSTASIASAVLRLQPRLVLLDLDLGAYGSGVGLIRPLTEAGAAVVIMTGNTDRARWGECVAHGARSVVSKGSPLGEVLVAIRKMSSGRAMMSREERAELVECWRQQRSVQGEIRARLDHLTRREAEVLGLLMLGKPVTEIARERFVSESTVRTQVKSVLAKLQVSSQLTAVGLAHHANWSAPQEDEGRHRRMRTGSRRPRAVAMTHTYPSSSAGPATRTAWR